jgi:membrane-associated protease RseP (regulator of RpoE activity)
MLFETIGAIRRKPVSQTVQNAVAYAGIAAMLLLFVYTLHADIIRLVSGGI